MQRWAVSGVGVGEALLEAIGLQSSGKNLIFCPTTLEGQRMDSPARKFVSFGERLRLERIRVGMPHA